jgi:type II secretory pathway pseudopilin PulG
MTSSPPARRTPRPSEEGFVLVAVIFLLAIFVLALSVAVPRMRASIELDRERETMQRGKQYARAIKLYYKKFSAYPPSIDALVKTNNIRFLRKRYTDPMTGKDDWRPIHFGENKTPMAMGFFGQPLAQSGSTVAGTGPSGSGGLSDSSSVFSSDTSATSSTSTSATGTSTSSGSTSSTGTTGQTFGGAGIVGFAPGKQAQSILLLKKKDHFNEWEFLYSPASDVKTITSGSATTAGSSSTSGGSSTTGSSFGSSSISGSSGSSSGSTSSGTP